MYPCCFPVVWLWSKVRRPGSAIATHDTAQRPNFIFTYGQIFWHSSVIPANTAR